MSDQIPHGRWVIVHGIFEYVYNVYPVLLALVMPLIFVDYVKTENDSLFFNRIGQIFLTIFSVSLLVYSLNYHILYKQAKIVSNNIRLNSFENITFHDFSGISLEKKERVFNYIQYDYMNLFNDKKEQFEAEFLYQLAREKNDDSLMIRALGKYRKCKC